MKKIVLSTFMLALLVTGCKKGENDPFLSIRSRKARVSGEWTVSKSSSDIKQISTPSGGGLATTTTMKEEIESDKVSINSTSTTGASSGSVSESGEIDYTINFNKDGSFDLAKEYSVTASLTDISVTETEVGTTKIKTTVTKNINRTRKYSIEEAGSWDFLNGVGAEYKKAERLAMNILERKVTETRTDVVNLTTTVKTTTPDTSISSSSVADPFTENYSDSYSDEYTEGENSAIMQIDRLTNKEMIMIMNFDSKLSNSNSFNTTIDGVDPSNSSLTTTKEGTVTITLSQGKVDDKEK